MSNHEVINIEWTWTQTAHILEKLILENAAPEQVIREVHTMARILDFYVTQDRAINGEKHMEAFDAE